MDYLMILLLILTVGTLNVACFFIGAKVGQKVVKGEPIETPSLNPAKAIREYKGRQESARKQRQIETIMQNIERYDGTGNGQRDVPRG